MTQKIAMAQRQIYDFKVNFEMGYCSTTGLHEFEAGWYVYKMPTKLVNDLKTNIEQYGSIYAWYKRLDPESKKGIERSYKTISS